MEMPITVFENPAYQVYSSRCCAFGTLASPTVWIPASVVNGDPEGVWTMGYHTAHCDQMFQG